ncbi:glycosyltransferase [Variovorax paradoxus]|nr:glycosyltransferase [Variovorax paradoxus]MBT2298872.1 glycosyltransferase [Variovorax paradoxus]
MAYEVVTSDDINACQPDFVLATHEFTPKLTPYFTIGAMWSPPKFYSEDQRRIKSILSYDGYLIGSSHVAQFIDALEFSTGVSKPRSDVLFLPTSLSTTFEARPASNAYGLAYIGVHWDGLRHNGLLALLDEAERINIYGPTESWTDYPRSYRGTVSFDGAAVLGTLARHGIALCIHKEEHRRADTPSMRLFEAAAAGCLIIADEIPFARRILGDTAFYIDMHDSAEANAARVIEIVDWANQNPALAAAMAARSHAILRDTYSLEALVQNCCDFVAKSKAQIAQAQKNAVEYFACSASSPDARGIIGRPLVDIIVRTGGRHLSTLRRALRSVARQTHGHYRVLLVDYKGREDVRACAAEESTSGLTVQYMTCPDTGLRSTALWTGLRAVEAPFFAMLDDDDTVMPTHFPELLRTAQNDPSHCLYYSGVIRVEEEHSDFVNSVNFTGPLEVEVQERRELKFLDRFSLSRLIRFDNYIQSNAWIARSTCLDQRALEDPGMVVVEDMYLYFMLLKKGSFKLSPSPTAYWHWRSTSRENSMLGVDSETWTTEGINLVARLDQETLSNGMSFGDMRHLLGVAPANGESTIPVRPALIAAGKTVNASKEVVAGCRQRNFHGAETSGIWSSTTDASIQLKLEQPVTELIVQIEFSAVYSRDRGQQYVDILINGQNIFSDNVADQELRAASGKISIFPATNSLFIRARCRYTVIPKDMGESNDTRSLGVFISTIHYQVDDPSIKSIEIF